MKTEGEEDSQMLTITKSMASWSN